jgi:hypothetical protein
MNQHVVTQLGVDSARVVGGSSVNGTFKNEYFEIPVGSAGMEGTVPVFSCTESEAAEKGVSKGKQLLINGDVYLVATPEPNNNGWIKFILEKQ